MDGLWFQIVEQAYGMDAALAVDRQVWEQFAVIEALRIKEQLALPENGGLDALEIAFNNRFVSLLNKLEILRPDEKILIDTTKTCRVQAARTKKGMAQFPCRSVGMVEFPLFARTIDPRIMTTCLSCPPETLSGTHKQPFFLLLHTPDHKSGDLPSKRGLLGTFFRLVLKPISPKNSKNSRSQKK
jgi:hypothetical protein